MVGGLVHG